QYILRTWTATDYCGNSSSETQRLTLVSENGPEVNIDYPGLAGADSGATVHLEANCMDELPNLEDFVTVDEGCSDASFSFSQELIGSGTCDEEGYLLAYAITVVATDLCGNEGTYTLTVELVDEVGPSFAGVPTDIRVSCGDAIPVPDVSDACSGVARVRGRNLSPAIISCPGALEGYQREWTAIDNCGNVSTFVQHITVVDETGPAFSGLPEDGCNEITEVPEVTAFDACQGGEVEVDFVEETAEGPCGEYIIRRWTAMDACGNVSTAERYIYFNDNTPPTIVPANPLLLGLEDGDEIVIQTSDSNFDPLAFLNVGKEDVDVSDDCAFGVTVRLDREIKESEDCKTAGYVSRHTYTWTATDPCGNSSTLTITVLFIDDYAPVIFEVPADVVVFCDDAIPTPGDIVAVDDYSEVDVTVSDMRLPTRFGERIIRTWTATDACGNESTASQNIDINANTLSCTIIPPTALACNSDGNTISVEVTGGQGPYTYQWEMNDYDGYITAGENEATMTFTLGYTTEDFRVTVKDANGCSTTCEVRLSCEPFFVPLVSDGEAERRSVNALYPNPASDQIFLTINNPQDLAGKLTLVDTYGKIVFEQPYTELPTGDLRVSVAQLPAGVYFAKLQLDGEQPFTQQFVIIE
ncbi:MAG: T9SS C-terminal target domain-containing protein, partial [Bacteroidetes bacterium]